jgi:hypothetical protein
MKTKNLLLDKIIKTFSSKASIRQSALKYSTIENEEKVKNIESNPSAFISNKYAKFYITYKL